MTNLRPIEARSEGCFGLRGLVFILALAGGCHRTSPPPERDAWAPPPEKDARTLLPEAAPDDGGAHLDVEQAEPSGAGEALRGREAELRRRVLAQFHEQSAEENRIALPEHQRRVQAKIVSFEILPRGALAIVNAVVAWEARVEWVIVKSETTISSVASLSGEGPGARVTLYASPSADPSESSLLDPRWATRVPLGARLRVRSLADARRRIARQVPGASGQRSVPESPTVDGRLLLFSAEGGGIDLVSGCAFGMQGCATADRIMAGDRTRTCD